MQQKGLKRSMLFANPEYTTPINTRWIAEEARLRESLAAYFLSVSAQSTADRREPPGDNGRQRERQKQISRAQRQLFELETVSALQSARIRRSLRYGDVGMLIGTTLEAAARRLEKQGFVLHYNVPETPLCSAMEPRIIQMAMVRLVRTAIACSPQHPVIVNVAAHPHSINISVSLQKAMYDAKALALAQAAARLHKGGVVVSDGVVAFSLRRNLTGAVGLFAVPGVQELLNDTLSVINIGFA